MFDFRTEVRIAANYPQHCVYLKVHQRMEARISFIEFLQGYCAVRGNSLSVTGKSALPASPLWIKANR